MFVRTAQHTNAETRDESEGVKLANFWSRVCHQSGGSYISGWLNVFFPYTNTGSSLESSFKEYAAIITDDPDYVHNDPSPFQVGELRTKLGCFPSGLSSAPFVLTQLGLSDVNMRFVAGFTGTLQDEETRALRPQHGWCVLRE
jgi:hypothetical protein